LYFNVHALNVHAMYNFVNDYFNKMFYRCMIEWYCVELLVLFWIYMYNLIVKVYNNKFILYLQNVGLNLMPPVLNEVYRWLMVEVTEK